MKIAVVGSNGRVGSLVVEEATKKGYEVTGIDNNENKSGCKEFINKNVLELSKEDYHYPTLMELD